jgi:WD40 repeat protein/serine/threonine protein kinase
MNQQDFSRIERAFHAALAAREVGGEPDLATLCDGDAALAEEVRSLLEHLRAAGVDDNPTTTVGFLQPHELHHERTGGNGAAAAVAAAAAAARGDMLEEWGASAAGQRVGDFTLIEPIGAGGMGVVFVAEQQRPRRTVALKLVRRSRATASMVRRFEREAHLLGRLNHPGIAQVYAAGIAELAVDSGPSLRVPYIGMELIDGPTILEYLRLRRNAPPAQRTETALRLLADACDAIQHAHQRGVIHRDLKPGNILIATTADGTPHVKVLDFGVARLVDEDHSAARGGAGQTEVTGEGNLVGTLAYMSPEQVRSHRDVDARSDVYALGVILYQLLTGKVPVEVSGHPIAEAARRIAEHEPAPLSSVDRTLRGDVETIVATALQKDVARRYQSPAELARDVRHHLAREPIAARRDSLIYLLRKRAERYRTLALTAGVLLIALTGVALYAARQQRASARAARAAHLAELAAAAAQRQSENAAARLAAELSASRIDQGRLLGAAGDVAGAERLLWDEYFQHPDQHVARWALRELYARSGCLRTIAAHAGDCRAMALAGDGNRFVTGGDEPVIRVWSVPGGELERELDTGLKAIRNVAFSPHGVHLLAAGEGGAVMLDLETGQRHAVPLGKEDAYAVDFAATGDALAIGGTDGAVRLFRAADFAAIAVLPHNDSEQPSAARRVAVHGVRFDRACTHLAAAYADGTVRLWNLSMPRGAETAVTSPGPPIAGRPGTTGYGVDFNPDGTLLASGSSDRTLTLWRVADGTAAMTLATNNGSARSAAFSPDGRIVAVPGFWRTQLFDLTTGRNAARRNLPALGDGGGYAAAFTPDGRLLIATGPGGTCRIWDLVADPATVLAPSTRSPVRDVAVASVGEMCFIASVQQDGEIRIRAATIAERPSAAENPGASTAWRETLRCNAGGPAQTIAPSPDGAWLVVGRTDGHVMTLATTDGKVIQDLAAHREAVNVVRLSPDGRTLVTGSSDDSARIWQRRADNAGWQEIATLACGGDVIGAAIRPDSRVLATTARPAQLQLWSLPDGKPIVQTAAPGEPWRVTFSPDGRRLATGNWNRTVQVWDVPAVDAAPPRLKATLLGHAQLVLNESFDATGELLASVSNDGSLRLWDLSDLHDSPESSPSSDAGADRRRCLLTLDPSAGDSLAVAFLPPRFGGGKCVAVGYLDGTVRVWDLTYFDRHMTGQLSHQRALRSGPATRPQ